MQVALPLQGQYTHYTTGTQEPQAVQNTMSLVAGERSVYCFRRKWSYAPQEIVWRMEVNRARQRKQYTGKEKLAILCKHPLEGAALSDIRDAPELQPTVFYRRQKQSSTKVTPIYVLNHERGKTSESFIFTGQGCPTLMDLSGLCSSGSDWPVRRCRRRSSISVVR